MIDPLEDAPVCCSSCHGAKRIEDCVRHSSDYACDEGLACSRRLVACERCNGAGALMIEQSERWRCDNLPPSEWFASDGEGLLAEIDNEYCGLGSMMHGPDAGRRRPLCDALNTITVQQWFVAGDPTNRLLGVLAALDALGTEAAQRAAAALRKAP